MQRMLHLEVIPVSLSCSEEAKQLCNGVPINLTGKLFYVWAVHKPTSGHALLVAAIGTLMSAVATLV